MPTSKKDADGRTGRGKLRRTMDGADLKRESKTVKFIKVKHFSHKPALWFSSEVEFGGEELMDLERPRLYEGQSYLH